MSLKWRRNGVSYGEEIGKDLKKKEKGNVLTIYVFSPLSEAKCPGGCRNGGYCNERQVCECQDGFYGVHCEKGNHIYIGPPSDQC